MAKQVNPLLPEPDPLAVLTAEGRKHIEALDKEIIRVRGDLDAMDTLEIDTSRMRERLDFAERARKVILERFT